MRPIREGVPSPHTHTRGHRRARPVGVPKHVATRGGGRCFPGVPRDSPAEPFESPSPSPLECRGRVLGPPQRTGQSGTCLSWKSKVGWGRPLPPSLCSADLPAASPYPSDPSYLRRHLVLPLLSLQARRSVTLGLCSWVGTASPAPAPLTARPDQQSRRGFARQVCACCPRNAAHIGRPGRRSSILVRFCGRGPYNQGARGAALPETTPTFPGSRPRPHPQRTSLQGHTAVPTAPSLTGTSHSL